jgi:hypothetical protein
MWKSTGKSKMNEEMISWLRKLANREMGDVSYAGDNDNYDDAYYTMGYEDGETSLAREILEKLIIPR